MTWETTVFKNLYAEPSRNGIYKPKEFHGRGIKIINMGELFSYNFISSQSMKRVELNTKELERDTLCKDDLLFGRRSLVESGAGKSSIIKSLPEPTTFESSIIRVRLDPKKAYPLFYYYWLQSLSGKGCIKSLVSGTNVKGIRGSDLKNITVPKPPIIIQKKIAEILSAYDDLIENNLKRIKLLEEMAQITFEEWFVQMRFPRNEANSNNSTAALPEGWSNCNIGSLVNHEIGGGWGCETENEEFSSPAYVIRGTDIDGLTSGNILGVPYRYHKPSNLQSRKLTHGDIIFEVSGGSKDEGVAKTALITKNLLKHFEGAVICASFCKLARPIDIEHSLFLFHLLRFLRRTKASEVFEIRSASNIVNYNWTAFLKFQKIKRPDNALLKAFYSQNILLHDEIYNLALQNQRLREARDILLPRLMTGIIDVGTYNPTNIFEEIA